MYTRLHHTGYTWLYRLRAPWLQTSGSNETESQMLFPFVQVISNAVYHPSALQGLPPKAEFARIVYKAEYLLKKKKKKESTMIIVLRC